MNIFYTQYCASYFECLRMMELHHFKSQFRIQTKIEILFKSNKRNSRVLQLPMKKALIPHCIAHIQYILNIVRTVSDSARYELIK